MSIHLCVDLSSANLHSRPMAFLSELAASATANNVSIIFYSGNDDSLVTHRGTEGETVIFKVKFYR